MSKGFSVDDILAEVEQKRGGEKSTAKKQEIDQILSEKPKAVREPIASEVTEGKAKLAQKPAQKPDFSVTEMLEDKKIREELKKPEKPQEPQNLEKTEKFKKPEKPAKPEKFKKEKPPKPEKIKKEKPVKESKLKKHEFKTEDIVVFKKAYVTPKPIIEDQLPPAPPEPEPEARGKANRGAAVSIGGDGENTEGALGTLGTFDFPKIEITQVIEKFKTPPSPVDEALKKRGEAILEADMSLEQPLEQIDSLNPFDVMAAAGAEDGKFISELSGDTKGIADGDLKELAEKMIEANEEPTSEIVKTYTPSNAAAEAAAVDLTERARRSNTALIESLNKALQKKRESDLSAYRTLPSAELDAEAVKQNQNLITHGLNIDYKKQILDTSLSLSEDPKIAERKIYDLAGKRKRKIRDFVLEDIEDEKDPNYYEEEEDEYDNYDTAGQTWNDLCETHRGLKIRFIILLLLTGFAALLAFTNDMGINMAYKILGVDVLFLDKRWDTTGFLYLNLGLGVIGVLACTTVIRGGFVKLFTGRADCDSLCAVPAVISVISVVPMLSAEGFIQLGYANIFVAAGLFGLLFNTTGKLMMMTRAKRNFKFASGDNTKYFADIIKDENAARAFTKGVMREIPVLGTMRKTEFLADFLKNSYCIDKADQLCRYLVPAAFGAALTVGLGAMFFPYSAMQNPHNIYWAITAANATLLALSPLSIMFLVNNPLQRASKALAKTDSVVLGYNAAEKFSKVNAVLVDAASLFPAGSVDFRNLKRCQQENSLTRFAIDEAIITAASLAIKSGSILTSMFYDMIAGKNELLYEIENCIYEVNMGISGWMGNKRVMLGNRDQMKHHGIKIPNVKKEQEYASKFGDVIYLAIGGETIAMFFLKIVPNQQIKRSLQALQKHGVSIIVRTRDSLVTTHSLSEAFELAPENLKIIPFDLHAKFDDCTKYASRGDGGVACVGTVSSFSSAVIAAKKIMHSIIFSSSSMFMGLFLAAVLCAIFTLVADSAALAAMSSTGVILYNGFFFILMMLMQAFKRY